MKIKQSVKDLALVIASLLLLIHMATRLVDLSTIVTYFPFDYTNDITSYLGQLHFLKVCGFHELCPYWYNGFKTFLVTPPGWYFFAFPWYILTGSVSMALYISVILMLIIALTITFYFGRKTGFSKIEALAIFAFIFGNAISIGNFLRLGRVHAMLNTVLFIALFFLIWHYRKKELDAWFLLSGPLFAAMIVTHYQETVLASLLFAGLLIEKKSSKERAILIFSGLLALVLSSWWLYGFLASLNDSSLLSFHEGKRALDFNEGMLLTNILTYLSPIIFIVTVCFYKKYSQIKKTEILFFIPSIILALLYVFRLHAYMPILRNISQGPYIMFFMIQTIILLIITLRKTPANIQKIVSSALILLSVLSISVNFSMTPWFEKRTPLDEEVMQVMKSVSGRYLIVGPIDTSFKTSYSKAYYSYGAIFEGTLTAEGWSPPLASAGYLAELDRFSKGLITSSCGEIADGFRAFNTSQVIAYADSCNFLNKCKFQKITSTENVCLYEIN